MAVADIPRLCSCCTDGHKKQLRLVTFKKKRYSTVNDAVLVCEVCDCATAEHWPRLEKH